ncbi:MAG: copper chaperone PCu(A)C [Rhodopseudomonas sp.]|nr:copper chaperone PCu(A)C [Rhodopseudomonas sp.]
MLRFASVAAITAMLMVPAVAHDFTVGALKIGHPWARATPKGASIGGGYMTVTNTGTTPDRLVSGASVVSKSFEVHEMSMDNGVMKMRMLPKGLEIKPGETVTFKPGGYHVMFIGLDHQLMQGQRFKATLQFEHAGKVDVDFVVEGLGAMKADSPAHDDMPGMKIK